MESRVLVIEGDPALLEAIGAPLSSADRVDYDRSVATARFGEWFQTLKVRYARLSGSRQKKEAEVPQGSSISDFGLTTDSSDSFAKKWQCRHFRLALPLFLFPPLGSCDFLADQYDCVNAFLRI